MRVGFAGLGLMGSPMAANLLRTGLDLVVYNRSERPRAELEALGAVAVDTPARLFDACGAVILMLRDDVATDAVLDRHGPTFATRVSGRLVVNMGTHAPDYSLALARDVTAAGGSFVEAPVSGSRGPAVEGALAAMVAGEPEAVARALPLLEPMCAEVRVLGAIPSGMAMKLSVNLYLVATVAALAEAARLAAASGLDLGAFADVIGSGPLRSAVATAKLGKMVRRDYSPEAAIADVCRNAGLVAAAATRAGTHVPVLAEARRLFEAVLARGGGRLDMAAVLDAFGTDEGRDDGGLR